MSGIYKLHIHIYLFIIACRLQTSLDYSYTAQFLAWMGYSAIEKGGLASALKGII